MFTSGLVKKSFSELGNPPLISLRMIGTLPTEKRGISRVGRGSPQNTDFLSSQGRKLDTFLEFKKPKTFMFQHF